jgi:hypothetical protein
MSNKRIIEGYRMEIEKARETSWRIQLKNQNEKIELTSVEISGEVRSIRLKLMKANDEIIIELNKEEFFNFLSLISAFKDVVIGDEHMFSIENYRERDELISNPNSDNDFIAENTNSIKSPSALTEDKSEDLNPEEWDPW